MVLVFVFNFNNVFGQNNSKAFAWQQASNGLFLNPGNVAIGLNTSDAAFHIHREINFSTDPYAVIRLSIDDVKNSTDIWDIGNFNNLHFKYGSTVNTSTVMTLTKSGQLSLGTKTPVLSAIMQLESTERGLLLPRLTTIQKDAINSPANGLLVYDTDLQALSYFDNGNWNEIIIRTTLNDYLTINDFNNSPAGGITNSNISNWNTAHSWGNHATAGYLTSYTETDPIFTSWNKDYNDLTNKPTLFDGQWTNLSGTPPNISIFANDVNYITDGNTNWNNEYGFITDADIETFWDRTGNNTFLLNSNDNLGIGTNKPKKAIHIFKEVGSINVNNSSSASLRFENFLTASVVRGTYYAWDFVNNNNNFELNFGYDEKEISLTETKFTFSKDGKLTANEFTNPNNDFLLTGEGIIAHTFSNDNFNVSEDGIVNATKFIGDGSELTNLNLPETHWFIDANNWYNLTYKGDIIIGDAENDDAKDGSYECIQIRPTAEANDDWYIGVNENEVNNSSFFIKKRNLSGGTFFIANNGNIGIGTTNPAYGKLQINYDSDVNGNDWSTHAIMIRGNDQCLYLGADTETRTGYIQSVDIGTVSSNLILNPKGGNVGIGTTTPNAKLHIVGSQGTSKSVLIDNKEIKFRGDGLAHFSFFANRISNTFTIENTSTSSNIGTAGSVLMAFNKNGNVGIGTTNPDEKLTVKGTIKCRKVKVRANAGADFVFEPDYKLMDLQELENYIKTEKHLPEIPSETEMQDNGLDLGKQNIKLLQKIEELTLYIIELNKRIEKLEDEDSVLKK